MNLESNHQRSHHHFVKKLDQNKFFQKFGNQDAFKYLETKIKQNKKFKNQNKILT